MAADNIDAHNTLTDSIDSFATDAAMQLVAAFHQQLDLDSLLNLFFRQCQALANSTGLRYLGPSSSCELGVTRKHQVRYNLQWPGAELGSLIVFFDRPAPEHALSTTEDLISLMAGALSNVLKLEEQRRANPQASQAAQRNSQERMAKALVAVPRCDSLILIALDDFESLQASSGDEWAQWILDSVQTVLREALREADGVFQIREGLLAVLLPRTHGEAAEAVAGKIGVLISTLHLSTLEGADQLTACMGIASTKEGDKARDVLTRAEQTLQLAKLSGPNAISRGRLRAVR